MNPEHIYTLVLALNPWAKCFSSCCLVGEKGKTILTPLTDCLIGILKPVMLVQEVIQESSVLPVT